MQKKSLCIGRICKFSVFPDRQLTFGHFPCFPCAVETLPIAMDDAEDNHGNAGDIKVARFLGTV